MVVVWFRLVLYCLHLDMAQSLFQELEGDRHEDLLINVHTLIDLPHFTWYRNLVNLARFQESNLVQSGVTGSLWQCCASID